MGGRRPSFTCMAVSVDGSPIDHPVKGSSE